MRDFVVILVTIFGTKNMAYVSDARRLLQTARFAVRLADSLVICLYEKLWLNVGLRVIVLIAVTLPPKVVLDARNILTMKLKKHIVTGHITKKNGEGKENALPVGVC